MALLKCHNWEFRNNTALFDDDEMRLDPVVTQNNDRYDLGGIQQLRGQKFDIF